MGVLTRDGVIFVSTTVGAPILKEFAVGDGREVVEPM